MFRARVYCSKCPWTYVGSRLDAARHLQCHTRTCIGAYSHAAHFARGLTEADRAWLRAWIAPDGLDPAP